MSEPLPPPQDRSAFYLVLASVIAGMTALGTWRVVGTYQAELAEARRPRDTVEIVVASRSLLAGEVLQEEDLALRAVPQDMVDPADSFANIDELIGEVVVERVLIGEPIRSQRLTLGGGIVLPDTLLERGTRAVTVKMERASGVGGMVAPGAYVDVIVTIRPDANSSVSANYVTETILQAVRVLAVGNTSVALKADPKVSNERRSAVPPRGDPRHARGRAG